MSASLFLSEHYRRGALWTVLSYSAAALLTLLLTDPEEDGEKPAATAPRPGMGGLLRRSLSMTPFLAGALCWRRPRSSSPSFSASSFISAPAPRPGVRLALHAGDALRTGGARSHRLTRRLGRRRGGALLFLCAGAACLTALCPAPLPAVAGVLGLRAAAALFSPLALSLQNAAAEPGARAAQLSCNAMVMDLVSLVLNPAFGRMADAGCGQALLLGAIACGGGIAALFGGVKAGRQALLDRRKARLGCHPLPPVIRCTQERAGSR